MEPYEHDPPHGNQGSALVAVPADKKWFTRAVVAAATVDAMWSLDPHFQKWMRLSVAEAVRAKCFFTWS
jgi:hypothetical protein